MVREIFNELINWIGNNIGRTLGGITGFIIAILVLTIGFFKTLFMVICIGLGIYIGGINNKREKFKALIEKLFSSSNRNL
ncbi:MAG: DUF2273 domain-containing protein [Tissierellia bacterium]|nr:DUF2273 domain-containing protein [Tissierellia bacterium]